MTKPRMETVVRIRARFAHIGFVFHDLELVLLNHNGQLANGQFQAFNLISDRNELSFEF
jgi:hypothetical protein